MNHTTLLKEEKDSSFFTLWEETRLPLQTKQVLLKHKVLVKYTQEKLSSKIMVALQEEPVKEFQEQQESEEVEQLQEVALK